MKTFFILLYVVPMVLTFIIFLATKKLNENLVKTFISLFTPIFNMVLPLMYLSAYVSVIFGCKDYFGNWCDKFLKTRYATTDSSIFDKIAFTEDDAFIWKQMKETYQKHCVQTTRGDILIKKIEILMLALAKDTDTEKHE